MQTERTDIEVALDVAAQIVDRDGEAFLPVFLRLEREVEKLTSQDSALERARKIGRQLR